MQIGTRGLPQAHSAASAMIENGELNSAGEKDELDDLKNRLAHSDPIRSEIDRSMVHYMLTRC